MPRKQNTNVDQILAVFKEHAELVYNQKTRTVAVPSDPIWLIISHELSAHQVKATPKYCYTLMKGNRYNLWQYLGIAHDQEKNTSSSSCITCAETVSSSENETDKRTHNFSIEFSFEEISNMIDTIQYARNDGRGSNRSYTILKPYYWTNLIHEKFYNETHIACAISYKNHKILEQGGIYLTVDGRCKDCLSTFHGEICEKPCKNVATIMECRYSGQFDKCSASSKRRLIGPGQSVVVRKLVKENKAASYIRKKFARKNMEYNEKEPSLLPTANALRCIKYKENKTKLIDEDPIRALCLLKGEPFYKGIIQDISIDPFAIHYWCNEEVQNYRMLCRLSKTPTLCIDATGSVVKKINHLSQQKSSHIFLYEMIAHDREEQIKFSVAHMLSEKHDNVTISYWLSQWQRSTSVMGPKIVVTDASLALMYAVTRSFTQYSTLAMYLSTCFKLLHGENADVPICQIRLDVNHVMHNFSTWNAFRQSHHPRFKSFFMKSLALLVMCTDYQQALQIIRNIFIICLFEYEGQSDSTEEDVFCSAKDFLLERISGSIVDVAKLLDTLEDDSEYLVSQEESNLVENVDGPNSFSGEIQNVFDEVSREKETLSYTEDENHINPLYCPEIATRLLTNSKHIALWSGIMVPVFNYGHCTETSAAVESAFKDLKHVTFKHIQLPIRIDNFVRKHVDAIIGDAILQKSDHVHSPGMIDHNSEFGDSASSKISYNGEMEDTLDPNSRPIGNNELVNDAENTLENQKNLVEEVDLHSQPRSHKPIESEPAIPVNSESVAENEPFSITELDICAELNGNNPTETETSEVPVSSESIAENRDAVVEELDLNIQSNNNPAENKTDVLVTSENNNPKETETSEVPVSSESIAENRDAVAEKLDLNIQSYNKPAESETDILVISENAVENWRNLNRVPRQRRKTHFDKDGALRTVNFHSKSLSPIIGLLKNGNLSSLAPVKIGQKFYSFSNTCPFDALIHIFCVAYADSYAYRAFCDTVKTKTPFFELISNMIRDGVNVQTYKKRGRIFLKMDCNTRPGKFPNYFVVDTRGLIGNLTDVIFKDYPSLIEKKSCPNCQKSGERKYVTLLANLYDNKNITSLEEVLQSFSAEQYGCRQKTCLSKTTISTPLFADHLIIEPTTASPQDIFLLNCKLDEIPKSLNLNNKMFKLRGIAEFRGSLDQDFESKNNMGHYISYCWREDTKTWQLFDDLQKTVQNVKPTLMVRKCALLVYTL